MEEKDFSKVTKDNIVNIVENEHLRMRILSDVKMLIPFDVPITKELEEELIKKIRRNFAFYRKDLNTTTKTN